MLRHACRFAMTWGNLKLEGTGPTLRRSRPSNLMLMLGRRNIRQAQSSTPTCLYNLPSSHLRLWVRSKPAAPNLRVGTCGLSLKRPYPRSHRRGSLEQGDGRLVGSIRQHQPLVPVHRVACGCPTTGRTLNPRILGEWLNEM